MSDDLDDIPMLLEPPGGPVRRPGDSESAALWEGAVELALPGAAVASGEGVLRWTWLPEPELRLTVVTDEPWRKEIPFSPTSITAKTAELSFAASLHVSGLFDAVERVLLLHEATTGSTSEAVDAVLLQLLNVPRFLGLPVGKGGQSWAGRIEFGAASWHIRIDGIPNEPKADEHRRAGFLVTHTGQITRTDGLRFGLADVQPVIDALCWLLSLLRGSYVSAPALHGMLDGEQLWTRHTARAVDPWAGKDGTFPTGFVAAEDVGVLPALGRAVATLVTLWGDSGTRDGLDRVLLWYVTANVGGTTGDIVLAQAGLELLAYLALVPTGMLTSTGFDRLTAADQVRLLLHSLGLPAEVPPRLTTLAAWTSGEHATGAPEAVSRFRNFMVHPPTRQRPPVADDNEVIVEARTLALSLLEQALLGFVGYDALIRDRVHGWQMRELR